MLIDDVAPVGDDGGPGGGETRGGDGGADTKANRAPPNADELFLRVPCDCGPPGPSHRHERNTHGLLLFYGTSRLRRLAETDLERRCRIGKE